MQHAGANALADQTAHAVFLKAHHGKADHLGAAARNGSAARQTGQVERRADGCAGNGQSQRNANQHRNQNAHQQGLQLSGPHDHAAYRRSRRADGRGKQHTQTRSHQNGDRRGNDDIDFGLFADKLAALCRNNGDKVSGQGAACTAQAVGSTAHSDQAEQHQRRGVQGVTDGSRHGWPGHALGESTGIHQKLQADLLAQRFNDGADQ